MKTTHTYEYFIASRVRNKDIVDELLQKLRQKGKKVYWCLETDTYHASDLSSEETMSDIEGTTDWRVNKMIKDIFEKDMQALHASEKLIMLLPLPQGKSVHIEAGVAYGMGKQCIMIGIPEKVETLYLIFSEHHATIDEFIDSLL